MKISKNIILSSLEAGIWKFMGKSCYQWISLGTLGLSLFNGGLSLFGRAVIESIKK